MTGFASDMVKPADNAVVPRCSSTETVEEDAAVKRLVTVNDIVVSFKTLPEIAAAETGTPFAVADTAFSAAGPKLLPQTNTVPLCVVTYAPFVTPRFDTARVNSGGGYVIVMIAPSEVKKGIPEAAEAVSTTD